MDYFRDYYKRGVIKHYYIIKHKPENKEFDERQRVEHWHFVIEYFNAKTLSAVQKNLSFMRPELIEICSSLRGNLQYLIHYHDIDKIRYNILDVVTDDKERYFYIIMQESDLQVDSDKMFLAKAYKMIDEKFEYCFADVIKALTNDKSVKAVLVKRYVTLLHYYFDSRRLYQDSERNSYYRKGD